MRGALAEYRHASSIPVLFRTKHRGPALITVTYRRMLLVERGEFVDTNDPCNRVRLCLEDRVCMATQYVSRHHWTKGDVS